MLSEVVFAGEEDPAAEELCCDGSDAKCPEEVELREDLVELVSVDRW